MTRAHFDIDCLCCRIMSNHTFSIEDFLSEEDHEELKVEIGNRSIAILTLHSHREEMYKYLFEVVTTLPRTLVEVMLNYCDRGLALTDIYQNYLRDRVLTQDLWQKRLQLRLTLPIRQTAGFILIKDQNKKHLMDIVSQYTRQIQRYVDMILVPTMRSALPQGNSLIVLSLDSYCVEPAMTMIELDKFCVAINAKQRVNIKLNYTIYEGDSFT
jgi:hypothetical protein